MTDKDPDLASWFARQQASDQSIREALRQTPVPEGLEHKLLLQAPHKQKSSRFPAPPLWSYAVAACLILTVSVFSLRHTIIENQFLGYHAQLSGMDKHAHFRDAMAFYISDSIVSLDFLSTDLSEIRSWLNGRHAPNYSTIPEKLAARTSIGCKEFFWQQQKVTLICFESLEGKVVHLFILEKSDFPAAAYANLASHLRVYDRNTAGWEDNERAYVLVGSHPGVEVSPFLPKIG